MRVIPESLQIPLNEGATTLARCWRIERSDGLILGFTDHDAKLTFDGLIFQPETGFTASSVEASTGMAAGTHEVSGILRSDQISETDLSRGLYDGANVLMYLVDWTNTASRVLLSRGQIGTIKRNGSTFDAEVVGLSDRLNQPFGRAYVHSCECRLGDQKCGISLQSSAYRRTGTVETVQDLHQFRVTGLQGYANGWFAGGALTWVTGANAGTQAHVKTHIRSGSTVLIETWLAPEMFIQSGDTLTITAGCDKTVDDCRGKFNNLLNFRGFPHMPGDDAVAAYPSLGGGHNGRSLLR